MSATGVGVSWPSRPTEQHPNDCQERRWIASSSSNLGLTRNPAAAKGNSKSPAGRGHQFPGSHRYRTHCSTGGPIFSSRHHVLSSATTLSTDPFDRIFKNSNSVFLERVVLIDLDPATAKLAIGFLGPFFSAFGFLFILRIVMSWYPKLPVDKFPYVIAYAPTEPLLVQTRKLIPPLGGVDVTPVVWFGLISFLNEILVGPQGLLVLLSQQV